LVSKLRAKRISDRIREELSVLLLNKVSDPRLEAVYITEVVVDRELAYANIYVSTIEGKERSSEVLSGLIHAQSFLRRELTQKIALRTFPQLRFHWDPTPEHAEQIERLITSIHVDTTNEKK
jgi:ribosome-binding factor A